MTENVPSFAQAHDAVGHLEKRAIPPIPAAYEVWLGYVLGEPAALKLDVDAILASGGVLDASTTEALYERHFSHLRLTSKVIETGSRLTREMSSVVTSLQNAARETHGFQSSLRTAADRLENASEITVVREMVQELSDEARHLATRNEQLEASLVATTREVEQLRASLEAARAESLTDTLTGLANRKLFNEMLRMRRQESDELGTDLCLVLCDIDHFKRFNDTWGHQTGDQIIRFVASSLTKYALPDFLVARYGGEEYAIIMPRTSLAQAFAICEETRKTIESKRLLRRSSREELGLVTVSFGLACYRRGEATSRLIGRADECLYASKHAGRNRSTTEAQMRTSGSATRAA